MYSNDADTVREALCFFMDEKQGYKTSYVQFPQRYHNINKNDTYSCISRVTHEVQIQIFSLICVKNVKKSFLLRLKLLFFLICFKD